MVDDRTDNYSIALPHPSNELQTDVYRLRSAITEIDARLALQPLLSFYTSDGALKKIPLEIPNG